MPWGCLCSKEKKRPQISSPILKPEDSQKLQLLPASRRPLIVASEKLEQRLLDANSNESDDDFSRHKLQLKLVQKSKLKSSNLKSTTYTRNSENDKLTKHLNNVKFAFDEETREKKIIKSNSKLIEDGRDEIDCNGNGNYDVLPLPKVEQVQIEELRITEYENIDENENLTKSNPVKKSTESIPFIDDEQNLININTPKKVQNFHDARIITLTPKNLESHHLSKETKNLKQIITLKEHEKNLSMVAQSESEKEKEKFSHNFIILESVEERVCQQCHQLLNLDVAIKCVICEFTCHQRCVQLKQKNNHEEEQQQIIPKYNSLPNSVQQKPNLNQVNNNNLSETLRLSYVTERMMASILPPRIVQNGGNVDGTKYEDEYEKELINMLEQKHGKNYRIFDLESCISTITLEKLCQLCKHLDAWLGSGREKIVVLQDREDRQRLGAAIAAYLEYKKICGSNFPQVNRTKSMQSNEDQRAQNKIVQNWLDLDIFSMQKFLENVAGPLRIPSHRRYIKYLSGLLTGAIKINSSSIFLKAIIVESPPCLHYKAITLNNEWRSFVKIFEGSHCLFTSDIYVIPITSRQFIYEIKHPIRLRGDIIVRCYQIIPNNNKLSDEKELISSVQFHTCAITDKEVQFTKNDLDLACGDERFTTDHKLTLSFDSTPNDRNSILVFQNPSVRIEPIVENGDNLETINEDESNHTQGPLDGSLYATILKSPKSPTSSFQQHLISPPAEFSNSKTILSSPKTPNNSEKYFVNSVYSAKSYNSNSSRNTPVQFNQKSRYSDQSFSYANKTSVGVESNYNGIDAVNGNGNFQPDSRESVRSPLTLSMDSGISSSGVVNRRLQGSSVSPSSFPSQASPQEDRHRELDDLLSDMLMTVQDIPDFGRNLNQQKHMNQQINHKANKNLPSASLAYDQQNENSNTIKRSQSSQSSTMPIREENLSNSHTSTSLNLNSSTTATLNMNKERDLLLYETSSTTTTLTPPPSESGRDTPLFNNNNSTTPTSTYSTIRDKREIQNINNNNITTTERELIMNLQHQSFAYPRQARSTTGASDRFTSDDDEETSSIPYHAREDSRPFTYGNIPLTGTPQSPPASTMIKMQSGLSSPSMVRKVFGTPQSVRKNPTRNDFEEMLRERREKIYNEKYTIGDKTPNGGSALNNNNEQQNLNHINNNSDKWNSYSSTTHTTTTSATPVNGYLHEPLKRSNTMDGSFGRLFSNDGMAGQTWLQLQQQKLRAKKEVQRRDHSNSFSYNYASPGSFPTSDTMYHTHRRSQTLSPVRNERNYHTMTTTKTVTNERPFVAVKRAHENAKLQTIGSPTAPLTVLNASPHGHIAHAQNSNSVSNTNQNGLLSFADEHSSKNGHVRLAREESFSSYRSETEADNSPVGGSPRPETPAFPVTPRTPYGLNNGNSSPALPPKSPTSQRKDLFSGNQRTHEVMNQNETVSCYTSRRNSTTSNANSEPQEVAPQFVKFAHDSSKYWYKPNITREEAVALLRNAAPGTFVVRDSTTFANAYGLVVKVAHPPPGVQSKGPNGDELVRHFLVEPTIRGVRLKGCANEPVFTSLSALVYQHSTTPLALPCRLIIPDADLQQLEYHSPAQQQLLSQGAACNVLYLFTCDTESLTGPQAVRKAVSLLYSRRPLPKSTQVHFKVSQQGITLTDNTRQLFFRRHYPSNTVSHCGLDPDDHRWSVPTLSGDIPVSNNRIFAFVAKRSPSSADNQCHVFCELELTQPASAITAFANKVVLGGAHQTIARSI